MHKELMELVVASASNREEVRNQAFAELLAQAEMLLREAVWDGDILFDIFTKIDTPGESTPKFPLDPVEPGTEHEYMAYTIPSCGGIPYRSLEGDDIMLHTYKVGNSVDVCLDYIKNGRFDVVQKAFDTYKNGFVQLLNRDGWRTIIHACKARNIIVADPDADQGQFTKKLVSLMMTVMERNGGGNSTSTNGSKLTDLYISTEAMANIRNWNVDQLDEITRREIFENDGNLSRCFGVNLHSLRELGVGQEFQLYAESIGVVMPVTGGHTDQELCIGLDQSGDSTFLMPVAGELETFQDPVLHRMQRWGIYGWMYPGFGVMDTRKVLFGSM